MGEGIKAPCLPDDNGGCELCNSWPGYCPIEGKCKCGCEIQFVSKEGYRCKDCNKLLIDFDYDNTTEMYKSEESANAEERHIR